MSVSTRKRTDPVLQICEHCLYSYGWFQDEMDVAPKRVGGFRPPYPCPRCGYLQEKSKQRLIKKIHRKYFSSLIVLCVSALVFTFALSGLSLQWGIRPFGPIAIGGGLLLIAVGVWSGMYRFTLAVDPNHSLIKRRKLAGESHESPFVVNYPELLKVHSEPECIPAPPAWSWEEAEKRYRSIAPETTLKKNLIRGFIYGLVPALICLGSTHFYLDLTRGEWEYSNLFNGKPMERTKAIEYLWNHGTDEQKDLVIQWFSTAPIPSQEADIYLIHLKPLRSHHYQKVLTGILALQKGVPGPQAWELLKEQPGAVANRILYYLDKGVGDPARHLVILAKLDPQTLTDTFEREIIVKPELVDKLGQYSTIMGKHWPVVAKGVLRSSDKDPRLKLKLINSFLRVAPEGSLDALLRESLQSLGTWVIEPVANDPKGFLRVALFEPKPEWVETVFEGIASVTEELIPLSVKGGDAIYSLGPEVIEKALDPMFGSAQELRWLKLRLEARRDPLKAAELCRAMIDGYVGKDWGTLTSETLAEQARAKEELAKTAQTLRGIPVDEHWVANCRGAYRIHDNEVRHEWAEFLSNASPEVLLRQFSLPDASSKQYYQWEVDSLVESIAENPKTTLEEIARLLSKQAEEGEFPLSPVVKYSLLDYLAKVGDASIVGELRGVLEDESTVYRSPEGIHGASQTLRIGDFAAQVIRQLEEDSQ